MALRRAIVSGWDSVNSVPKGVTPASDFRAGLSPLAIREGVFYTTENACAASGTATMAVELQPFTAAIESPLGGFYYVTADDVESVTLDAADSSNARIDVIYIMQEDYQVDPTKVDSLSVLSKVTGTPAVSPSAPTVPAGALALWECEVPAGAVNTNDGVIFTPMFGWTVAVGGTVPFRTKASLELWLTAPKGQSARVLADGSEYESDGAGGWLSSGLSHVQMDTTNSVKGMATQYGIGRAPGSGTSVIRKTVTFPVPFAAVPVVALTVMGRGPSGAFDPSGGTAVTPLLTVALSPTTTGFTAHLEHPTGATPGAGNDYYFSWSAAGVLA